jgi:hypothetical protein
VLNVLHRLAASEIPTNGRPDTPDSEVVAASSSKAATEPDDRGVLAMDAVSDLIPLLSFSLRQIGFS